MLLIVCIFFLKKKRDALGLDKALQDTIYYVLKTQRKQRLDIYVPGCNYVVVLYFEAFEDFVIIDYD